jgi:hypothetical protein
VVVVLECRGWGVTCCIITFMNPMSLELLKAVSIPDNCKCVDLVIAPFRCKDSRRRVMLWNNRTGTDNCEHGPRFVFTSQTHFWNSPLPALRPAPPKRSALLYGTKWRAAPPPFESRRRRGMPPRHYDNARETSFSATRKMECSISRFGPGTCGRILLGGISTARDRRLAQ